MSQRVVCPHCSEKTFVDINRKVQRTKTEVGTLNDGYDRSGTCSKCGEKFACKVADPSRQRR
ncbi:MULTISPECIES: hypothetical protein [Halopiger]|uniref:Uncharacterized protein n=2 Tax=Halopiger TaxID=387342 RepID=F8D7Q9_HALXS|nr:hypothetical protein [Halopiger aswanensis]AEH35507.1 hypothetical protein Halxa_0868 [Halopiger xanaduensis SH-6]RKD94819.1 hypothetical protein ATJ93_1662 [Halopiger aswanensis]